VRIEFGCKQQKMRISSNSRKEKLEAVGLSLTVVQQSQIFFQQWNVGFGANISGLNSKG